MEKLEEMNQEFKRHVSSLDRSNDEHKRLARKREKELEQVTHEFEHNVKNASTLHNKVSTVFSLLQRREGASDRCSVSFSAPNKMLKSALYVSRMRHSPKN